MSETEVKDVAATEPAVAEPATEPADTAPEVAAPTEAAAAEPEGAEPVGSTEADAAAAPAAAAAEPAAEAAVPAPVSDGVLGYKGPGLIRGLRFSKKHFWFGDEAPVPEKALGTYLKNEKAELAHPTAAHASQTGDGLLMYAKRVEDKTEPSGVLNLSHATDLAKELLFEFSVKINGQKHAFQAASHTEREVWYAAFEKKIAEAKTVHENIVNSEGYKSHLAKLAGGGGLVAAAAAATTSKSPAGPAATEETAAPETAADAVTTPPAAVEEKKLEPKTEAKSRSQSRKRASIFGTILGKKDKKEEKTEAVEEPVVADSAAEPAAAPAVIEPAPLDAAAVASRALDAPVLGAKDDVAVPTITEPTASDAAVTESAATESTAVETPAATETAPRPTALKSKRGSIFGSLFKKEERASASKEADVGPPVPSKDVEPVADAPPQLDPVDTSVEPAAESTEAAAEPAVEEPAAPAAAAATAVTPPAPSPKSESKGGLFGFLKPKDAPVAEKTEEAKVEEAKPEPVIETPSETTAASTTGAGLPESSTVSTATATAPAVASEPAKERRRSSFFGGLGKKKEKSDLVTSDSEVTDGEGKKSSGLGGLFRKASRSAKTSAATESSVPPVPVAKDVAAEATPAESTATELGGAPLTNGDTETVAANTDIHPLVPETAPVITASA